jgi:DNA-binding winged helix-turn-helix (wHTH) protein/tetratricopeptide (TPR) repeat protein
MENFWSFPVAGSIEDRLPVNGAFGRSFRVGDFQVDPDLDRIRGRGEDKQLEPKAMAVLTYLAERQGQVVSARELIETIWSGRPMGDNPVYRCISQLRRAFGDDPLSPEFIVTVPTKGYRLVAPVLPLEEPRPGPATDPTGQGPVEVQARKHKASGKQVFLGIGVVVALSLLVVFWNTGLERPENGLPVRSTDAVDFEALQNFTIGREMMVRRPAGFLQSAQDQFDRAIELDPGFAEAYAERAIVKIFMAISSTPDPAIFESAQKDIRTALSLNPQSAQAHAAQGFLLQRANPPDFVASEEQLRRAVNLDPSLINAWNWLSTALLSQGLNNEAYQALRKAALIDPLAPSIGANLAGREARRGAFDEAEKRLTVLLGVPQPASLIYVDLSDLYRDTGRLSDALDVARNRTMASVRQGGRVEGLSMIWSLFSELGDRERADYWRDRQERESGDASMIRLERIREELGTAYPGYSISVDAFDKTLIESGMDWSDLAIETRIEYGAMKALSGDYAGAVEILEPALASSAQFRLFNTDQEINAKHALAWAWLQSGETDRANALLESQDREFKQSDREGRLHRSSDLFAYARNEVMLGNHAHALDLLEQAEETGWRGYFHIEHDPRWDALRNESRFADVMDRVRAAIALQRVRTETDRPDQDFIASLDAMILSIDGQTTPAQ